ncbi:hypothetical protein OZX69_03620 [Lactobacillus sp. ESL0731]|uniref:hypothetical protein n=1 Tax=unclassified Lactobacillus TaxID=2620435 RepID=UPI0023F7B821|nr:MULTISPECIES: hypothetical protein [unclassified Lactobacillus]WEV51798.1 hypothetical protein OZX63_03620 [Lactobacillus sp. ESL0700]WEV62927.1 hypothetical protein OZX69_03620 [Lactobacillus sp. ESL0731]
MGKNVVIAQFFTNMYDRQRGQTIENIDIVKETHDLYESVAKFGVELHTLINFKNETTPPPLEKLIQIKTLEDYPCYKMYFLRWEVTFEYLLQHPEIEKAALVDAGDVEMLNYPFDQIEDDMLYVGDEDNDLTGTIITNDAKPLYLSKFIDKNRHLQLLNTGVMVGTRKTLLEFLAIMVKLIVEDFKNEKFHPELPHLGDYEMGITCYILYEFFQNRTCHGRLVNTRYKYYERNSSAWFKHK